ncbi:hypothetical protein PTSG_04041 [Salpingoeca rosetta]|uniref:S-formylglutathione hydrolase n=1 Tax=Salpingoeca rosetta (strain ATCC 50818 / BSB-021) TaxID=946362 RepID=F2U7L7_SALR5|nr:uncharacterized protein PTSG_04041 [Salpingoeca rosetta]EGD83434.1 hypothetical protein PTSG_04041 [Salpingoeca rosetta]|eukprot:XP_004994938.1 hypothetical protein PTSG_04041 [Salpingoeca rosetta]
MEAKEDSGDVREVACFRCHDGHQRTYEHWSSTLHCRMRFSFFSPRAISKQRLPVIYFLSGLSRTEQTCPEQGGTQQYLCKHNLCMVWPDTSPRGLELDKTVESAWYGPGASFYVDATEKPWEDHYRMFTYITQELPALIEERFNVTKEKGVCGHSMGGHGALMCMLKQPKLFNSVSVFAPLCSTIKSPVSQRAMLRYFGEDKGAWAPWDVLTLALQLPKDTSPIPILIDQACVTYRRQEEFGHGYYFLQTFIADHISFHAKHLNPPPPPPSSS